MFLKKISPYQLTEQEEEDLSGILQLLFDEYDDIRVIKRKINSNDYSTFFQFAITKKSDVSDTPEVFYRDTVYWWELVSFHIPTRISEMRAALNTVDNGDTMALIRKLCMFMYIKKDNITTMLRVLREAAYDVLPSKTQGKTVGQLLSEDLPF